MWEKLGQHFFEYTLDSDICDICISRRLSFLKDNCKIKTYYNENMESNRSFCWNRPYLKIVSLRKFSVPGLGDSMSKYFSTSLTPILVRPAQDLEEIDITIFDDESARITKEYHGCSYDSHMNLDISIKDAIKIIESLPLFNDGDRPSEDDFGIKLNIIDSDKRGWVEAYENKFSEIRTIIEKNGKVVPPLYKSPIIYLVD